MILDKLTNADKYITMHHLFAKAFKWLQLTDLTAITVGKYLIDEENIFAIVDEYQTLSASDEQMEAHKKYIDIQYMVKGKELVGLSIMNNQSISKPYDDEKDFLLVSDQPSCFVPLSESNFMIFYPTDLHIPCIKINEPASVKKIIIKIKL